MKFELHVCARVSVVYGVPIHVGGFGGSISRVPRGEARWRPVVGHVFRGRRLHRDRGEKTFACGQRLCQDAVSAFYAASLSSSVAPGQAAGLQGQFSRIAFLRRPPARELHLRAALRRRREETRLPDR